MSNNIKTQVWLAPGVPATPNKAGYEALTYVRVNGVVIGPQPGIETSMIDVPDLATGFTKGEKGASIGRTTEVTIAEVQGDTGQANLKTYAAASYGTEVTFRLIKPDGLNPYVYVSGLLHSYLPNPLDTESFRGFVVQFRQNFVELETTAPT
jgi:hypothetical protein